MTIAIIILVAVGLLFSVFYFDFLDELSSKKYADSPIKKVRIRKKKTSNQSTYYVVQFKHLYWWTSCKEKEILSSNGIDTYTTIQFSSKERAENHLQKFIQNQQIKPQIYE